jgi:hypothetical protein
MRGLSEEESDELCRLLKKVRENILSEIVREEEISE